ncbi:MAG TPA: hypothetical protein VKB38_17115 [Terracidiphilus sp.]|nr:hypothetical protein [Terracidiphilus sp.]
MGLIAAIATCGPAALIRAQELPSAPAPQSTSDATQTQSQPNQTLQQRVLGLFPNYFVVYTPHPAPLTPKQKFVLTLRSQVEPMAFAAAAVSAAYGQAQDDPGSLGQGTGGYFKRLGAAYGANTFGNVVGDAIMPSILKQDPRYFYKGAGSAHSRFLYAIASTVVCMGDNGRWQANVSQPVGSLAAAGISELEYPPADRMNVGRIFKTFAVIEFAAGAENVFQEFFSRPFTSRLGSQRQPAP